MKKPRYEFIIGNVNKEEFHEFMKECPRRIGFGRNGKWFVRIDEISKKVYREMKLNEDLIESVAREITKWCLEEVIHAECEYKHPRYLGIKIKASIPNSLNRVIDLLNFHNIEFEQVGNSLKLITYSQESLKKFIRDLNSHLRGKYMIFTGRDRKGIEEVLDRMLV
jgi:hypothetical protein